MHVIVDSHYNGIHGLCPTVYYNEL